MFTIANRSAPKARDPKWLVNPLLTPVKTGKCG